MTTPITTSTTDNQIHNNIMAAGSRDHPPMLATGRYTQWQSRFMRYVNTKPNGEALGKCILQGPYKLSNIINPGQLATDESPTEVVHLLLTGIGVEIYSTVDACKIAHDMWIAIERLQLGESLNKQDVKSSLFWEFEDLLHEMESQLSDTTLEWSRFMTIVKQTQDLDKESYHELFDILKQYQEEVNEIHAEKIARNANPLALVVAAQQYLNTYYQAPKPHKSYAPPSKQSFSTRSHASTRYKGKEIAKPIIPPSESASEEDSDPEQTQRDKDMQKNLAVIAKYFKKIYQPTNNNIKTSSNTRNKNVDTFPRYKNDNQTGQFGNQMTVTVAGARETVGSQVVKQTRIQCFNCKEFRHFAKECFIKAEQVDWLEDTDEEVNEQELEAHYSFMAKIQEVLPADSGSDAEPLENVQFDAEYNVFANKRQHSEQPESINNTYVMKKVDSNAIPGLSDMCDNDNQVDQNTKECDVEHVVLANLIANLKLDTDENKNIQKQLKKANTSLSHELQECKSALKECKSILDESIKSQGIDILVIHESSAIRPQLRSTQMKEKVMHNNSQVKFKKTEVEDHHRISSVSNKTKFVTACNDSLKSRMSNVNVVCITCGKYVFNSNHDACASKFINDVNAKTKKPKVVSISTRKPNSQANKSVATSHKKIVASDPTI
ncbi:hypothetical protein Tco_0134361 [Tanacetum coccineum]